MVLLVLVADTFKDADGIFLGRVVDFYRLEATLESSVFFNVFTVFCERGCADTLNLSTR